MANKKWIWDDRRDAVLRELYDSTIKGRPEEIARRLKMSRWAVNRRAVVLGLSRRKDRPWTAKEEAYLEANLHWASVRAMAKKLRRTPTAIKLKAKRLGLRKHDEGYTASSLADALGVDQHWVLARIRSGKLRASRRHTDRTALQGGDSWLITDEAVLDLIREYPYDIDLRRVDSLWFMDLLAPFLQRAEASGIGNQAA